MDTGDKVLAFMLILIVVLFFGALILAGIDTYNSNVQECMLDGKALSVEAKYHDGVCQFATESGIWLDELDYLMLTATDCK